MRLWKHKNNTDVAFICLHKFWISKKQGYKIKVDWFNIVNPANVFRLGCRETIFVKESDIKNWEQIDE